MASRWHRRTMVIVTFVAIACLVGGGGLIVIQALKERQLIRTWKTLRASSLSGWRGPARFLELRRDGSYSWFGSEPESVRGLSGEFRISRNRLILYFEAPDGTIEDVWNWTIDGRGRLVLRLRNDISSTPDGGSDFEYQLERVEPTDSTSTE